ncbi:MAG: 2OG-Fe(II) oxygenase [Planctomycetota bacterium]
MVAASPDAARLAELIAARLAAMRQPLVAAFASARPVRHFVVDDLLPGTHVQAAAAAFPRPQDLLLRTSLRERKRVGVDVDRYAPILRDLVLAFQAPAVVAAVAAITGLEGLEPDPSLYASGLSVMGRGDFLNPHLDNSHDGDQQRYRVLNLLLYVQPLWRPEYGGSLELWSPDRREPLVLPALGNRLVVMQTDRHSWHSVSPVQADLPRLCVSNYYFAERSATGETYRHVTTFAGRPEQTWARLLLKLDAVALNTIGRALPGLVRRTRHRRA